MKFVNSGDVDINGTSLKGYIRTNYAKLVEVLGRPTYTDNGDKTTCEWDLKFEDGTVATIYDYKEERTPKGEYEWHIGGHNRGAVIRVAELFTGCVVTYSRW